MIDCVDELSNKTSHPPPIAAVVLLLSSNQWKTSVYVCDAKQTKTIAMVKVTMMTPSLAIWRRSSNNLDRMQ